LDTTKPEITSARSGRLDILVNNAGIMFTKPVSHGPMMVICKVWREPVA
jgi:NAD(P)-dependent dehydrogenase (short-subunit alcohol dehydrogenase family)